MILICAQHDDPHVASVASNIKKNGGKPIIFERFRRDHFISYVFSQGEHSAYLNIEGCKYCLSSDFISVWWRIKPLVSSELPGGYGGLKEQFCVSEWRNTLYSLSSFLLNKKWINPLSVSHQLNNKPYQLLLATQCGLLIPETVITNDANVVSSFIDKNKRTIYKSISSFYSDNIAIYTTEIDQKIILSDINAISIAPSIYQTLIEKEYELRVTVVGNKVFTAKIDSQKTTVSKIDWRQGNYDDMFSEGYLSESTKIKLLNFHNKSGLVYAAYDFIVDKNGKEIFLECNPSGQWLWLEDQPGLAISKAVANELMNPK